MTEPKKDFDEDESESQKEIKKDIMNDYDEYFKGENYLSGSEVGNYNINKNKSESDKDENNNSNFDDQFEKAFFQSFKETKNEDDEIIKSGEVIKCKIIVEKSSINKNQEKKNENKLAQSISNSIPNNNPKSVSEELPKNYKCPHDNKLSGKPLLKLKDNLDETTREYTGQKKGNINNPKFTTRKHGRACDIKDSSTNFRKLHNKYVPDNKITKTKSFILNFLTEVSNQLSEKITNEKKYYLHKICGYQAGHRTVDYDKKLMKKQLKIILSDTKDDYNKNIINKICLYEEINTFLELELEDIFNYLKNKEGNRIAENNKIKEKAKDQYNFCFLDNLDFYSLYQNELIKRNDDDKEIIGGQIKKDFVKLINGRKSKKLETKNEM